MPPVYLFGQPGGNQAPPPSFLDTLLQRFAAGASIVSTIKEANQAAAQRQQALEQGKLQMELFKHQLNAAKLQEQTAPLETQLKIAQLLQGMPGQSLPSQVNPQAVDVPGMANVPSFLGGPGGYQPSGQTTTFGLSPTTQNVETPNAPVNVDLSAIFPGRGNMSIPILNREQMLQQTLRQKLAEAGIEAQSAGAKAGAEAGAKYPFERALESDKAAAEAARLQYTQSQENARAQLSKDTSLKVAGMNLQATNANRLQERANKLTDDFRTDTAPFAVMDDAFAKIKAAASIKTGDDPTGASDVALLYGYMKLLDPNSAVREGEVALAQQTQGIPGRVVTAYNNALNGQKLSPAARQNFITAATKTYEAVQPRLKMIEGRYQDRAKGAGVDPKLFKFQSGVSQPPAASGQIAVNPQTGAKVQWNGSAWVPVQ